MIDPQHTHRAALVHGFTRSGMYRHAVQIPWPLPNTTQQGLDHYHWNCLANHLHAWCENHLRGPWYLYESWSSEIIMLLTQHEEDHVLAKLTWG
jgi:hypothetical protein